MTLWVTADHISVIWSVSEHNKYTRKWEEQRMNLCILMSHQSMTQSSKSEISVGVWLLFWMPFECFSASDWSLPFSSSDWSLRPAKVRSSEAWTDSYNDEKYSWKQYFIILNHIPTILQMLMSAKMKIVTLTHVITVVTNFRFSQFNDLEPLIVKLKIRT